MTFVQWHLWATVQYNLIPGTKVREIWSREAWKRPPWAMSTITTPFELMARIWMYWLSSDAPEWAPGWTLFPYLTSDGRMYSLAPYPDVAQVWAWVTPQLQSSPREYAEVGEIGEVANNLVPSTGDPTHRPFGVVVAWGTGELFAVFRPGARERERSWVQSGPFWQPGVTMRTHPPIRGPSSDLLGMWTTTVGCDRLGRRLYFMFQDVGSNPPVLKVGVVSTRTWAIEHCWEAPYGIETAMAITNTEHVVIANWDGPRATPPQEGWRDRWIGVYSRQGELVQRWAVECTPTRLWSPRWLRYDPRTNQLALFLGLAGEIAVYVYA
jgi:hypothetical protein